MRLHSTVLLTRQLERLRDFYTGALGLRVLDDFGACVFLEGGLSLWRPGAGHPVQAPPAHPVDTPQSDAIELCFEADTGEEFERVAYALLRLGLPVLHDLRTEPWGQRTIRLRDPDGNLIEWGESIPCFVRRLSHAGNSVDAIAAHTGVAPGKIRDILA